MIVLPSQLATYDKDLGFVLLDGRLKIESSGHQSALVEKEKKKPQFDVLKHQSYQEHISGLVKAYDSSIKHNLQYVIYRLEELMGLPQDSIDQAIRLAIACHDLGKLGKQWQQWAWDWQLLLFKEKGWPSLPHQSYFFAKTDFDYNSPEHWKLRERMKLKRQWRQLAWFETRCAYGWRHNPENRGRIVSAAAGCDFLMFAAGKRSRP